MKRIALLLLLCGIIAAVSAPAGAAARGPKTLGTDPAGDAPPGLDVTYLQVQRTGADLEVRIGLTMAPAIAGYPNAPGIQWTFVTSGRTFAAEAVKTPTGADFYLFELADDGSFHQLPKPTGTYSASDGYASVLVPLKSIGARSGSVVSGAKGLENGDVDAHVHVGTVTHYADGMETTGTFRVP